MSFFDIAKGMVKKRRSRLQTSSSRKIRGLSGKIMLDVGDKFSALRRHYTAVFREEIKLDRESGASKYDPLESGLLSESDTLRFCILSAYSQYSEGKDIWESPADMRTGMAQMRGHKGYGEFEKAFYALRDKRRRGSRAFLDGFDRQKAKTTISEGLLIMGALDE